MESSTAWLHPTWAFALPIAASFPLGWLMWRSLDVPSDRAGRGLDAMPMFLCRLIGRRPRAGWTGSGTPSRCSPSTPRCSSSSFGLLYFQARSRC